MPRQAIKFSVVCILAVLLWLIGDSALRRWTRPVETVVIRILSEKLGPVGSDQKRLLKETAANHPLESLFAAHQSGWAGIEELNEKGPGYALAIPALALKAGKDKLDKATALGFVENTSQLLGRFARLDPQLGAELLNDIRALGVDEYRNMAFDPSYILIVRRLDPAFRDEFRTNQELLTPLLTLIDPKEWDRFMMLFTQAQPRIAGIVKDPALTDEYAWSYLINHDLVLQLTDRGFSESDAVHFLMLNSETTKKAQNSNSTWVQDLKRMQNQSAPPAEDASPMTLFDWACVDPSLSWVIFHDPAPDRQMAIQLMARYAGSELPTILRWHYPAEEGLLQPALDALHRFDNEYDSRPERRGTASRFLNHYQNDALFKRLLRQHGARLIPALASGGESELASIDRNFRNIDKYIDKEGKPKSTWWHYIPGGSIVAVIRDLSAGRTVTTGEWAWAALDAAVIVAITATSVKALSTAKGLRAAQPVGRALKSASLLGRQGAWGQLKMRALPILAASGKIATRSVSALFTIVKRHPVKALIGAMAVYYALNPEALSRHSQEIGRMAATVPSGIVSGIWDAIADQIKSTPGLSFLYYPILIVFSVLVLGIILTALKYFIRPVWDMLALMLRPFRLLRGKNKGS